MSGELREIRVGIAGLGYAGQGIHAASMQEIGLPFKLVAACDVNVERMKEVCGRWGTRPVSTLEELARDAGVDLVVIATKPYDRHVDEALMVLEAGKHVVVEKPVALTLADARRLEQAAAGAKGRVFPHQNARWNLAYQTFREAVDSGVVGEPLYIELRKRMSPGRGGAFYDYGPHGIDMVVAMTRGRTVTEVTAVVDHPEGAPHCVGFFDAAVRFRDGLLVRVSFLPDSGTGEVQYWYAAGTKGAYHQEWFDIPQDLFRKQCRQTSQEEGLPFAPERFALVDRREGGRTLSENTSVGFYRNVAEALAGKEQPCITPADIVEQLRIMEAILESGRRKRTVQVG